VSKNSKKQRAFRAFLLTAGLVCLLCGIFVPWLGRRFMRDDHDKAIPQQAVGEVVLLLAERIDNGVRYDPNVQVRFAKGLNRVPKITNAQAKEFIVGQSVNITYRVGKTGKVYVDAIAPLTETQSD